MIGFRSSGLFGLAMGVLLSLPLSSGAQAAPYQRYLSKDNCAAGFECVLLFPKVPSGKRLIITNVACYLRVSDPADLRSLALDVLSASGTTVLAGVPLVPVKGDLLSPGPNERVYSSNDAIYQFAQAGQQFRARATQVNGAFGTFACNISGQL